MALIGSITASCGHKLADGEEGVDVIYKDEQCLAVEGFIPVIVYGYFCQKCAAKWRSEGLLFDNNEEAEKWLMEVKYPDWR